MKSVVLLFSVLFSTSIFAQAPSSAEFYIEKAQQLKLASNVTWQRLMYVNVSGQSEVTYRPFFIANTDKLSSNKSLMPILQHFLSQPKPINRFSVAFRHVQNGS